MLMKTNIVMLETRSVSRAGEELKSRRVESRNFVRALSLAAAPFDFSTIDSSTEHTIEA